MPGHPRRSQHGTAQHGKQRGDGHVIVGIATGNRTHRRHVKAGRGHDPCARRRRRLHGPARQRDEDQQPDREPGCAAGGRKNRIGYRHAPVAGNRGARRRRGVSTRETEQPLPAQQQKPVRLPRNPLRRKPVALRRTLLLGQRHQRDLGLATTSHSLRIVGPIENDTTAAHHRRRDAEYLFVSRQPGHNDEHGAHAEQPQPEDAGAQRARVQHLACREDHRQCQQRRLNEARTAGHESADQKQRAVRRIEPPFLACSRVHVKRHAQGQQRQRRKPPRHDRRGKHQAGANRHHGGRTQPGGAAEEHCPHHVGRKGGYDIRPHVQDHDDRQRALGPEQVAKRRQQQRVPRRPEGEITVAVDVAAAFRQPPRQLQVGLAVGKNRNLVHRRNGRKPKRDAGKQDHDKRSPGMQSPDAAGNRRKRRADLPSAPCGEARNASAGRKRRNTEPTASGPRQFEQAAGRRGHGNDRKGARSGPDHPRNGNEAGHRLTRRFRRRS